VQLEAAITGKAYRNAAGERHDVLDKVELGITADESRGRR